MQKHRIVHVAFSLVALGLSFFVWRTIRNDFSLLSTGDMLSIGVSVTVALSVLVLSVLLFSRWEASLVFCAFLVPFIAIVGWTWQYLLMALLSFLLFVYATAWMRHALNGSLKASFYPFVRYGAPTMLTALAVLFACAAYFYPFAVDAFTVSPALFDWTVPFLESFAGSQFPGYQKGMTVDEFISAGVAQSLEGVDQSRLPREEREAIDEEIARQKAGLEKQFGIALTGGENLQGFLALVANAYVNRYLVSFKEFVPIVVAAFVFFAVKSVGFAINRLAVLLAWLMAKILIASGVVRKDYVGVQKEILTLAEKPAAPDIPLRP